MVRETRHLWVGNLPENIREDRIREHFKRYGRVQSVKLLPRVSEEKTGEVQMACTVAFMDIKSAAKAHNAELKIDDRTLNTEYYEPAAIPSAASPHQGTPPPYSTSTSPGATRFPNGHGSSDEHGFPDPSGGAASRFYERQASGVGAAPTSAPEAGSGTCRGGRNRDRFRGGGGAHRGASNVWGTTVAGYTDTSRYNNSNERSQSDTTGYSSAPSSDANDRRNSDNVRKKAKSRSGSRSPSPNGSTSSRSPSRSVVGSRSRSSSSSSSSSTSRGTSSTSSPFSRRHRRHYKKANAQLASGTDDRRPLGICVRNLPARSSDTSLKDGLFHEYKKHGKVTWVKVVGQNADRHAIVCFKKPEDAEKALEVSYDKLFFGCKIEVAPHSVCEIDEVECRYESEIDEYNPKATRTLFIGNLEKDVTASDLRKHFDQFGEIIEIDIKKQGAVTSYAFCQYSDIVSVVKAIRKMDGEHLGNNRIKLGFGKSMAYNCVWIDGVADTVTEKYLRIQFEPFGTITKCAIDREKGQALVFYEHVSQAQLAIGKMRGFVLKNNKLQVDFASRECQEGFFERLKQQGAIADRVAVPFEDRREPSATTRVFETNPAARINRYDTPTRPRTSSYSSRSSVAAVASPGTPGNATPRGGRSSRSVRYYDYDLDYGNSGVMDGSRHTASHRSYDEYSQGSGASHEDPYDPYDHPVYLHESPGLEPLEGRVVQNLIEVPYAPHDIRNLQKERVHLLEQLEECPSSGDELIPKKRLKLDLLDPAVGDVIIEANRDHNRKVMEVRRLTETALRHHARRPSIDNKYGHYAPHTVGCKRRRTAGSDAGNKTGPHAHYTEQSDGSEQAGSRPGTPLCDENPEFPPGEPPKRTTRDRDGPMILPLPKWAAQIRSTPEFQRGTISVAGIKGQKDHVNPLASPPPVATSPRVSHLPLLATRPPSPSAHAPPPASPPPRPPSLSSNSSDSDGATGSPSLEERIKSLDERYEKWSGSRTLSAAGNEALAVLDANREKFRLRHKLLEIQDPKEVQPSEIVKSILAKPSVFDEDLKRLECVGEKYEPKEFGLFCRLPSIGPPQLPGATVPVNNVGNIVQLAVMGPSIKLPTSTTVQLPKTPTVLSPRSSGSTLPISASRGLQYPFPSHPPMQITPPAPSQPPLPPAVTSSATLPAPPPVITPTSTSVITVRNSNLGENRLKPSANVPGDSRTSSAKNRSVATVVSDVTSVGRPKPSEKVIIRRNSSSTSPRADVKTRRNSDTGARRIEENERSKSEERRLADKAKEELEKQRKAQEEKERAERERFEKEKLERERREKERLETERLERERVQREKERTERERIRQEKERAAKLERERLEKEKQERLHQEKEEQQKREREERELKEKLERETKEREQKAKEDEQMKEKDRRKSEDRANNKNKNSDNHHERSSNKHRENHSDLKPRENNSHHHHHHHDKQSSTKETREEPNQKDASSHDALRSAIRQEKHTEKESDRRKESVKENRDNNIYDKHKHLNETKDRAVVETRHMSLDFDSKTQIIDSKDPNRRKERNNSLPANVGLKRRMSSHETSEAVEAKKIKLHDHKKLSERRDSKDSAKSDEKLKKSKHKNNSYDRHNSTKDSDERRKEKEKEREERHKRHKLEKQKSKSKSREKESKDNETSLRGNSINDKDFLAKLNLRSNEEVEKERQRKDKDQNRERRPKEHAAEADKKNDDKSKRDKHLMENKDVSKLSSHDDKQRQEKLHKKDRPRRVNTSDSDSDEPRKHSIFDIVDDGPPYISMYDKVKARSCKNMQKQEEEKRQEKIKAKFSQLKLSRARREEKKRSTSWDEDSDSDKDAEVKSRRNRKVLESSDESQDPKSHNKRKDTLYTDSDNSLPMSLAKTEPVDSTDEDVKMKHSTFKSKVRIASDSSEDEYHFQNINKRPVDFRGRKINDLKTSLFENDNEPESDNKPGKVTSIKHELERLVKKERRLSKYQEFVQTEPQSLDSLHSENSNLKFEKTNSQFDNSTDDDMDLKKEKSEKRERKLKKKQKKPKHSFTSEESSKMEVDTDSIEKKHHEKKKEHSRKDKRREKSKDNRDKPKRTKKIKSEDKAESKKEGKMETIFGSLSEEDTDVGTKNHKPEFLVDENAQPPPVYNSDSDKEPDVKSQEERNKDIDHKRKKEKKRKEKERRMLETAVATAEEPPNSNENSMDFADMCKQLEANIKDDISEVEYKTEVDSPTLDTSSFMYVGQDVKKDREERREGKERKKKRKKSKDERRHHHHHHHHHDKSKVKVSEIKEEVNSESSRSLSLPEVKTEIKKEEDKFSTPSTPSGAHCQSLPSLVDIQSPVEEKSVPDFSSNLKRDKIIPSIGAEIDEKAVKSISVDVESTIKEEPVIKGDVKEESSELPQDKPRVIISQEETEDAVAALLGESFGSSQFDECYSEELTTAIEEVVPELVEEQNVQDDEEMRKAVQSLEVEGEISKPDTPQSEHELQIDTDTEEQDETSQPVDPIPKTPEVSKTANPQRVSSSEKPSTPSPTAYKSLSSPPSLTLLKPQPSLVNMKEPKATQEVAKLESPISRTVIAQTWVAEKKDIIPAKLESTEVKPPVVLPGAKIITAPPIVKATESSYPPPMVSTVVVQQSRHNLPACLPVQGCKVVSQENLSSVPPTLSRLPITPVMVTKPLQATTIYLPQSKVAQSSEPPKLTSTTDIRQERPRMVFTTSNMPSTLNAAHPPRMILQGNIRHLSPTGLLVPTRHMNSTGYGQILPNTSQKPSYVPLPKESHNLPELVSSKNPIETVKTPIVDTKNSVQANIQQLVVAGPKPIPTTSSDSSIECQKSPLPSQSVVATSSPRQSPKSSPIIIETEKQESLGINSNSDEIKPVTEPVHLSLPPLEVTTSTPSPVIVVNPEVKIESNPPPSPVKLAIEKVTEELNLSLEKKEDVKGEVVATKEAEQRTENCIDVDKKPTVLNPERSNIESDKSKDTTREEYEKVETNRNRNECADKAAQNTVVKTSLPSDGMSDNENKEPSPSPNVSEKQDTEKKLDDSLENKTGDEPEEIGVDDCPKVEIPIPRTSTRRGRGGRGRGSNRVIPANVGGIQTRRGKLKETQQPPVTPTASRRGRGSRARNERKSSRSESESTTNDVYEFREDSDDSNKEQRPRLVLTIKAPTSSASNSQATAFVKEITKDGAKEIGKETRTKDKETSKECSVSPARTSETKEEFSPPPIGNTRKSRRLAEKDISKNAVDDTIEDVIKSTPLTRSAANQRRSGRIKIETAVVRKSTRGRKPSRPAAPEVTANTNEEIVTEDSSKPIKPAPPPPPPPVQPKIDVLEKPQPAPEQPPKEKTVDHCSLKTAMLKRFKGEMNANKPEPTNLIDPVTGMLTPMRESEEGKYIPLPGTSPGDQKVAPNEPAKSQACPQQVTVVQQTVPKVHPLKAHVLSSQAAKAVVSEMPQQAKIAPCTNLHPQANKETVPQMPSPNPSVVVSKPGTPLLMTRSGTPMTSTVMPQTLNPLSPRPAAPVAEVKPQVKPPVLSPGQQLMLANPKHASQLQGRELFNQVQSHMSASMSLKQAHLVNNQLSHIKHPVIMGAKTGITTRPPHSAHQQPLPGQIAASPVEGKIQTSGRIIQGPQVRANLSPSGPQARSAGLPVPGYEGEPMSHFPPGSLRPPDITPAHYMHPQHLMYQHMLRQQQQQHYQRSAGLEKSGEGEEAPVGFALSGRGATVPHHSPHDRSTESPAIGQAYSAYPARLPACHPRSRYFDQQPTEPPPAHLPRTSHDRASLTHMGPLGTPDRPLGARGASHSSVHLIPDRPTGVNPERPMSAHLVHERTLSHGSTERMPLSYAPERPLVGAGLGAAGNLMGAVAKHIGMDAPAIQRGIQAATPPLASQVPPQADSLYMLLKQYPLTWQGLLALKNDQAAVQMYFVSGNEQVAKSSLPKNTDGTTPPLRIFQRMRLEPMQVEGVARKMQMEREHCMLLALPCGRDDMDVLQQSRYLATGFISYLQQKQAAGIVNVAAPGTTHPPAYVVHIFPSCDFVNENLRRIAPSLLERVADLAHLLIVITTV